MNVRQFGRKGHIILPQSWVGKKVYVMLLSDTSYALTSNKLPTPEEFRIYDLESQKLLSRDNTSNRSRAKEHRAIFQ